MSNTDATTAIVQKLLEAWSTDSHPSGVPSRSARDEVVAKTEATDRIESWELVGPNMHRPSAT